MNPKTTRYFTYIRPIIRSKFARAYSSLIFSLITVAIFSFYALRPTITTILSLQKSINEQNQVLTKLQEKVNNLSQGKRNFENIDSNIKTKLENLIPSDPALDSLINTLVFAANTADASISGLQLEAVQLENPKTQPTKNAPILPLGFTINTKGGFANQMKLLTNLKRSDRLITIDTIRFSQPVDSSLIMSISGKAYYLKN